MSAGPITSSLKAQFTQAGNTSQESKMVAEIQPHGQDKQGNSMHSTVPDSLLFSLVSGAPVSIHQAGAASPAYMESLIGHTMEELLLSHMEESSTLPQMREAHHTLQPKLPTNIADIFCRFSDMLSIGLCQTAAKITGDIKAELQKDSA